MRHPRLHRWIEQSILFASLPNHRWYRRWQGGHWERWYIECCRAELWLDYLACTRDTGGRPPLGLGTPTCETWP